MASIYLQATINGQAAGTLWQDQHGIAHFTYESSYRGAPLSVALPLKNQSYHNTELLPYLFGLLPDSERQRSAIAREFGIRPNNAVAMLEHIGLDCPRWRAVLSAVSKRGPEYRRSSSGPGRETGSASGRLKKGQAKSWRKPRPYGIEYRHL